MIALPATPKKKVGMISLGCAKNLVDAEIMLGDVLARGMQVSQVAAASGYATDSAFCAMFKAATGQSPTAFQHKKRL